MLGGKHEAVARTRETLARVHLDCGRPWLAVEETRRALAIDIDNHGPDSLAVAGVRLVLAEALELDGDEEGAAVERSIAAQLLERIVPAEHPLRATTLLRE